MYLIYYNTIINNCSAFKYTHIDQLSVVEFVQRCRVLRNAISADSRQYITRTMEAALDCSQRRLLYGNREELIQR